MKRRLVIYALASCAGLLPFLLLWLALNAASPRSIIGDIESAFNEIGGAAEDVLKLAGKVWQAFAGLWGFLQRIGTMVNEAWDWMVNGVDWFGGQLEGWAAEVFGTLWHIATHTIPGAVAWAITQAVRWAAHEVAVLSRKAKQWVDDALSYLERLVHKLVNDVKGALHTFKRWATDAIRWVLHWGPWIVHLLKNPINIAEYILRALVEPLVAYFLTSSAPVFGWLFRRWVAHSTEGAHTIEQILADVI